MPTTLAEVKESIKNSIRMHQKEIWIAQAKIEALQGALWELDGVAD